MKQVLPISKAAERLEVPEDILGHLRSLCLRFPETFEESAWVGTRWVIGQKNFAHVLAIDSGWPPAYAEAAGSNGPLFVMTFRSNGRDSEPPEFSDYPFFRPVWFANIVGMIIDDETDWKYVGGLLAISYSVVAPKRLAHLVQ